LSQSYERQWPFQLQLLFSNKLLRRTVEIASGATAHCPAGLVAAAVVATQEFWQNIACVPQLI
jgi:hypothetical protein